MITIKAKALEELVRDIFHKAGCSKAEGARIGKYLVSANLTGHDSHGVVRVPRYLQWHADGKFIADQKIKALIETPVYAMLDGNYGFGQTITPQAVKVGIDKCKAMGLAMVGLRNVGHIGRVGDWAEMAAAEKLISIHFVNASGSVLVAPFGGVEKRFSTAPFCCGIPVKGRDPLILDFATSVVAEGKVLVASRGGKKLPEDALVGLDGTISADPHLFYGDYTPTGPRDYTKGKGAIRAFGDHKGSGLAFMCEMLGGSLTGTGATSEDRGRFSNGMLSFYIDPERIDPDGFFPKDIARYVKYVKGSKPIKRGGEVLVPGETESRTRKERLANGVPLATDIWKSIVEAAERLGIGKERIAVAVKG